MLEESLSCSSPKAPVHQYGSLAERWGIHGAQWGVRNTEKKAEWEEQEGTSILKEEFVCPKELSFKIKVPFSLLACRRDADSQSLAQGSVPSALGKDAVVSLKLNLPYPYIKKISL